MILSLALSRLYLSPRCLLPARFSFPFSLHLLSVFVHLFTLSLTLSFFSVFDLTLTSFCRFLFVPLFSGRLSLLSLSLSPVSHPRSLRPPDSASLSVSPPRQCATRLSLSLSFSTLLTQHERWRPARELAVAPLSSAPPLFATPPALFAHAPLPLPIVRCSFPTPLSRRVPMLFSLGSLLLRPLLFARASPLIVFLCPWRSTLRPTTNSRSPKRERIFAPPRYNEQPVTILSLRLSCCDFDRNGERR